MKPINEYTMQECLDRLYDNYDPTGVEINILELACRINTLLYEQAQRHDARVDALENKINALRDKHRWIPVEERLPTEEDGDENGRVLVCSIDLRYDTRYYKAWKFDMVSVEGGTQYLPTHWKRIDKPDSPAPLG